MVVARMAASEAQASVYRTGRMCCTEHSRTQSILQQLQVTVMTHGCLFTALKQHQDCVQGVCRTWLSVQAPQRAPRDAPQLAGGASLAWVQTRLTTLSPLHVPAFLCPCSEPGAPRAFTDMQDSATTGMGQPLSGSLLANAYVPDGDVASVTGFTVQGSSQLALPDGQPVELRNVYTGKVVGRIAMRVNGSYTFDPVPGFVGGAPPITTFLATSTRKSTVSSLSLEVLPGREAGGGGAWKLRTCGRADKSTQGATK